MYALLIVVALIVCGSLYPWHFAAAQAHPWLILMRSWPPEWTYFTMYDASLNMVVYLPLGALAFLTFARRHSPRAAAAAAILTALLLSLSMELLQAYIPGRTSSLFDVVCNVTGGSLGALAAWRFRKMRSRIGQHASPPVLMLCVWACYHLYPFVPMILFSRMRFELMLWLHPQSVSIVEIWSYAAEWVAVGIAAQRLFGRMRLWWLPMVLAFHFAVRPFVAAKPLVLEEALGVILALFLWKTLPEPARSSPWLLISAVLARECASAFWWVPAQMPSSREGVILFLSRATFDCTAIFWLWRNRGMSYAKSGAIVAGGLAALAVVQYYLNLPGAASSTTDTAVALLVALMFQLGTAQPRYSTTHFCPEPSGRPTY